MFRSHEQDRILDTATQALGHAIEPALELDSAAISKTKSQISGLVSEIAALARSHRDPTSYATDMLPRLAQSMAATGAALWSVDHDGSWHAIHCYAMPDVLLEENSSEESSSNNNHDAASLESKIDRSIGKSLNAIDSLIDPKLAVASATNGGDRVSSLSANSDQLVDTSQTAGKPSHRRPSAVHRALLAKVHQERQPVLVPPGASKSDQGNSSSTNESSLPVNPTAMALIFAPVPVENSLGSWWLQVVQTPSGGVATQRGYLRFVAQIADLTADFLKTYRLREHQYQTRVNSETSKLLEIASNRNASARPGDILPSITARIRDILECDQVFIVHRYHRNQSWQTLVATGMRSVKSQSDGSLAISLAVNWFLRQSAVHQQQLCPTSMFAEDRRLRKEDPNKPGAIAIRFANSPILQGRHGSLQAKACADISRTAESDDDAILRFNAMFTSAITTWIPIFSDQPNHDSGVGLLVYWSWPSARPSPEQLDRLLAHTQQVTSVVLQASRPPAISTWTGNSPTRRKKVSSRILSFLKSRVTVALITAASLVAAGFIPVQSYLISPATIVAAKQYRHYASSDATVRAVHVDYGQEVTAGQILIELEDRNLQRLYDQTEAEMRQIDQQMISLNNRLLRDQQLSESNRFALEGELDTLRKLAPQTAIRLSDLRKQIDALKIVASSDGVVTTWNASQSLQDRPVRTGQLLVSVQATESPWMIEARMPQHRSGQFLKLASEQSASNKPIEAQFSLASQPLRNIPAVYRPDEKGSIVALTADSIHDSIYRVRFAIPKISDKTISSGSAATLRIDAGRAPLWKALLGDAINGAWAKWRLWTGL
jgi:multidrug efflux pump subunit AcrA (membrane-fusion protein)